MQSLLHPGPRGLLEALPSRKNRTRPDQWVTLRPPPGARHWHPAACLFRWVIIEVQSQLDMGWLHGCVAGGPQGSLGLELSGRISAVGTTSRPGCPRWALPPTGSITMPKFLLSTQPCAPGKPLPIPTAV